MKFNFTKNMLASLLTKNKEVDAWYNAMVAILPKYDITTPERVAGFIAQCSHESLQFTVLEENLNYSEAALHSVFGKYFRDRSAVAYARKPEKIANIVYASRMGNGSEKTGDGWKFRGRGVIQLTGHDNYTAFGKDVGKDVNAVISYLGTKEGALESACWYWNSRDINKAADAGDITKMTKLINGGTIGLEDRKKHYEHALEVLGAKAKAKVTAPVSPVAPAPVAPTVIKTPAAPKAVHSLFDIQTRLGLRADGINGPMTTAAIIKFQSENGLTPDGVVGPKTLNALFGV
jgi:putative chitinase